MIALDFFEGLQCEVTETHIKEGDTNDAHRCPIALSLNHALETLLQEKDVADKYQVFAAVARGLVWFNVRQINTSGIHMQPHSVGNSEAVENWIMNYDHSHDEPLPNNAMAHDPQPITVRIQGDTLQEVTT